MAQAGRVKGFAPVPWAEAAAVMAAVMKARPSIIAKGYRRGPRRADQVIFRVSSSRNRWRIARPRQPKRPSVYGKDLPGSSAGKIIFSNVINILMGF